MTSREQYVDTNDNGSGGEVNWAFAMTIDSTQLFFLTRGADGRCGDEEDVCNVVASFKRPWAGMNE